MKILWTVNLIPEEPAVKLGMKTEVLGGWVEAMADQLRNAENTELAIACKCAADVFFKETINGVTYYSLGYSDSADVNTIITRCKEIVSDFSPDIVQIEGTEFLHAKAMIDYCKEESIPVIVSLQGILNGQYNYQCGQLQIDDMMFSKSLTSVTAAWLLHLRKVLWYKPRMKPEREIIEKADYILGRTSWDRAHSYAINPGAKYYSCNRVLRKSFYETDWQIDNIERHSIYIGNGYYALKGVHFVIMALPQLIREYPDVKLYIAGYKPYSDGDNRSFIKKGYGAYLKKLIADLGVENHVEFTGPLKAHEVAERLSKVNAYVLCSAIENSPNTLGEAMMIGTPCVSAYVGGASDMAEDKREALFYRNDDPKLLAWNLKQIFDNDELALKLSENGRRRARITHDAKNNAADLLFAYNDILTNLKEK